MPRSHDVDSAPDELAPDLDSAFAAVYAELKRVAHRRLASEVGGHTLNTTALVNETYLKLAQQRAAAFGNRAQFFALAALAMRRILVDYARRHDATKREGAQRRVPVDVLDDPRESHGLLSPEEIMHRAELLIGLDSALEELRRADARAASVVECRFFLAMHDGDIAELLGVTPRTIGRDWARARAWLRVQLRGAVDRGD